jgi:hypothetical protein
MSQWMAHVTGSSKPVDFEILQESALAMAQATISNAIGDARITRSQLAARMNRPRSFISKMLSGSHNLTIKTFALALAACGFEVQFTFSPIQWGWVDVPVPEETCEVVPTESGHFHGNNVCIAMEMPILAP